MMIYIIVWFLGQIGQKLHTSRQSTIGSFYAMRASSYGYLSIALFCILETTLTKKKLTASRIQNIMIKRKRYDRRPTPTETQFLSGLKSRVLKLTFFDLKMMVKFGLEVFFFLIHPAPSELLLPSAICSAQKGWIGLAA